MRFTIEASELRELLTLASRTTDRKDPIKSCIKLEAIKKGLKVMSTAGHSGSCLNAKADVDTPGEAIVPSETLLRAIRQCDGETEISIKNNNLLIANGELEFTVLMVSDGAKKFPFTEKKSFSTYVCDLHELVAAMKMVHPAADTVHEVDFKGVGIIQDKKGLRVMVMSKSSAAGYTGLVKAKVDGKKETESVIVDPEFATLILSLNSTETYDIAIGIDHASVVVAHSKGYTYLPLLTGKPYDPDKALKILVLDTPTVLASAGLLAKAVRSVLVMGDKEEGYKGRLIGGKGVINLASHSNQMGAAKNSVIIAGELKADSWYNFRTLLNNVAAVNPDDELQIHVVPSKHADALVLRKDGHIFWIVSCTSPEGVKDAKSKESAKDVP